MNVRIFLACEDRRSAAVVQALVDEIVVRGIDWLRAQDLDPDKPAGHWKHDDRKRPLRTWAGRHEGEEWFKVHSWAQAIRELRIDGKPAKLSGRIDGKPAGPDVWLVRACLLLARHVANADVAVIVRDVDREPVRARALAVLQKAELVPAPLVAVLASPVPEIEAWIVAGFEPKTDAEGSLLDVIRQRLKFDPTQEPHHMSSQGHPPERDAKAVHDQLMADAHPDRWKECLASLFTLDDERLEPCGAADFFRACRATLVPWIRVRLGS